MANRKKNNSKKNTNSSNKSNASKKASEAKEIPLNKRSDVSGGAEASAQEGDNKPGFHFDSASGGLDSGSSLSGLQSGSSSGGLGSGSSQGGLDSGVEALRKQEDEDLATSSKADNPPLSKGEEADAQQSTQRSDGSGDLTIVIPYRHASAKGDELLYAIRAWEKFLPQCRIVIIGDTHPKLKCHPEVIEGSITHIEFKETSKNPQVNAAQKMLAAIESELVSEYFIWSNDDIYPLCPLTLTDTDLLTAMGPLRARGSLGGVYRQNSERTVKALAKEGVKRAFDYATHTPVGFLKEHLKEIIERFKADKEGHLVSTLYFNLVYPDARPIIVDTGANVNHKGTQSYVASVYRRVAPGPLAQAIKERKFMNNNDAGYDSLLPHLKKLFPNKSSFEK